MAVPNLPGSFLIDFNILVATSEQFLNDFAIKSAGPRPATGRNEKAISTIKNNFPIRTLLQNAINNSGLNQIKVAQGQTGTFPTKYVNLDTWKNQFFIIRTQLVGLPPPYNYAVTVMDNVWNKVQQVSSSWKISRSK